MRAFKNLRNYFVFILLVGQACSLGASLIFCYDKMDKLLFAYLIFCFAQCLATGIVTGKLWR